MLITRTEIYMHWHAFLQLLITNFVGNVHESHHVEANGGYFILHILNKMHIIAYFNNKHVSFMFDGMF